MNKSLDSLLMGFNEHSSKEYSVPYTYVLRNGTQYLYYFGARHSDNLDDPQFKTLKDFWDSFLKRTTGRDRLAVVEGGRRSISKHSTDARALELGGEMHLVSLWARRAGISVSSPEPSIRMWFTALTKHFPKDAVAYYDFARTAYQWNRKTTDKPPFREYIAPYFEQNKTKSGWKQYDFSFDHMTAVHEQLFHKPFDEKNEKFFYEIINPTTDNSIINQVSRYDDSGLRDAAILQNISRYWKSGKSLFIIYGASHAVIQEQALRHLVVHTG